MGSASGETFENRFPPSPLLNSFCRIPCGILILIVGAMDGNMLPIVWNLFFLSLGTEKWGSWGRDSSLPQTVVPVRNSVCHPPHDPLGGGLRRNLNLEMRQQFETKCNERSELHADWGRGREPPPAVRRGRDSFRPRSVVPVCISVCHHLHEQRRRFTGSRVESRELSELSYAAGFCCALDTPILTVRPSIFHSLVYSVTRSTVDTALARDSLMI